MSMAYWNESSRAIFLALTANILYTSTMLLVKYFQLKPGELCLIKGVIQLLVYGISSLPRFQHKTTSEIKYEDQFKISSSEKLKSLLVIVSYGTSTAMMTLFAYVGVNSLPLTDVIVLSQTAHGFKILLSWMFLGSRITPSKVFFCCLMIFGVVLMSHPKLIAQPGNITFNPDFACNGSYTCLTYLYGSLICIVCAICTSVSHLTSAQSKKYKVTPGQMMLSGGIATIVLGGISPIIYMDNRFLELRILSISVFPTILLMIFISVGSMLGGIIMVTANKSSQPAVISVVRSSQIILGLFVDKVILGFNGKCFVSVLGTLISMLSIIGMTTSDWIELKVSWLKLGFSKEKKV